MGEGIKCEFWNNLYIEPRYLLGYELYFEHHEMYTCENWTWRDYESEQTTKDKENRRYLGGNVPPQLSE